MAIRMRHVAEGLRAASLNRSEVPSSAPLECRRREVCNFARSNTIVNYATQ